MKPFVVKFLDLIFLDKFKIGEVCKIPIYLSSAFLTFIVLTTILAICVQESVIVFYILIPYFCILLHELGHSITAKYFKYSVNDITLYPFMGAARMDIPWDNPRVEFWITVNGPAVNVVLAFLSFPLAIYSGNAFVVQFFIVNCALFAFNIIPMFPMDGGRILRAGLGLFFKPFKAATIAITVSTAIMPFVIFVFVYWFQIYQILYLSPVVLLFGWMEYSVIKEANKEKIALEKKFKLKMQYMFPTGARMVIAEKDEKFLFGILEFEELAFDILYNKFPNMDHFEFTELVKKANLKKIFIDENGHYKMDHPNWKDYEEYWVSPTSYRKYIVAKIIDEALS